MLLTSYLKSYLEIPVVLGVALCHGSILTHLFLNDQTYHHPDKKELLSHIQKMLFGIPAQEEFFEGTVLNYYLYVYRIDAKFSFLTLVLHENNVIKSFRAKQLKSKLQEDVATGLQIFKELEQQRSISGQLISQGSLVSSCETSNANELVQANAGEASLEDILSALNTLSRFACRYLGPKITSNFWNLSRPKYEWLYRFEIKYSSEIVFRNASSETINPLQMLWIREWTQNFMQQCHRVVRDLPQRFEKETEGEDLRKIISIYTLEYLKTDLPFNASSNESLFGDFIF